MGHGCHDAFTVDTEDTCEGGTGHLSANDSWSTVITSRLWKPWDGKAAKDPAVKSLLEDGVRRLDQDAKDKHKLAYAQVPWEADRVVLLQGIEQTDFSKTLRPTSSSRSTTRKSCGRSSVTRAPPPSTAGYIKRGFNGIDWLRRRSRRVLRRDIEQKQLGEDHHGEIRSQR